MGAAVPVDETWTVVALLRLYEYPNQHLYTYRRRRAWRYWAEYATFKNWCIIRNIGREGPDELAFKTAGAMRSVTIDNEEIGPIMRFIQYKSLCNRSALLDQTMGKALQT